MTPLNKEEQALYDALHRDAVRLSSDQIEQRLQHLRHLQNVTHKAGLLNWLMIRLGASYPIVSPESADKVARALVVNKSTEGGFRPSDLLCQCIARFSNRSNQEPDARILSLLFENLIKTVDPEHWIGILLRSSASEGVLNHFIDTLLGQENGENLLKKAYIKWLIGASNKESKDALRIHRCISKKVGIQFFTKNTGLENQSFLKVAVSLAGYFNRDTLVASILSSSNDYLKESIHICHNGEHRVGSCLDILFWLKGKPYGETGLTASDLLSVARKMASPKDNRPFLKQFYVRFLCDFAGSDLSDELAHDLRNFQARESDSEPSEKSIIVLSLENLMKGVVLNEDTQGASKNPSIEAVEWFLFFVIKNNLLRDGELSYVLSVTKKLSPEYKFSIIYRLERGRHSHFDEIEEPIFDLLESIVEDPHSTLSETMKAMELLERKRSEHWRLSAAKYSEVISKKALLFCKETELELGKGGDKFSSFSWRYKEVFHREKFLPLHQAVIFLDRYGYKQITGDLMKAVFSLLSKAGTFGFSRNYSEIGFQWHKTLDVLLSIDIPDSEINRVYESVRRSLIILLSSTLQNKDFFSKSPSRKASAEIITTVLFSSHAELILQSSECRTLCWRLLTSNAVLDKAYGEGGLSDDQLAESLNLLVPIDGISFREALSILNFRKESVEFRDQFIQCVLSNIQSRGEPVWIDKLIDEMPDKIEGIILNLETVDLKRHTQPIHVVRLLEKIRSSKHVSTDSARVEMVNVLLSACTCDLDFHCISQGKLISQQKDIFDGIFEWVFDEELTITDRIRDSLKRNLLRHFAPWIKIRIDQLANNVQEKSTIQIEYFRLLTIVKDPDYLMEITVAHYNNPKSDVVNLDKHYFVESAAQLIFLSPVTSGDESALKLLEEYFVQFDWKKGKTYLVDLLNHTLDTLLPDAVDDLERLLFVFSDCPGTRFIFSLVKKALIKNRVSEMPIESSHRYLSIILLDLRVSSEIKELKKANSHQLAAEGIASRKALERAASPLKNIAHSVKKLGATDKRHRGLIEADLELSQAKEKLTESLVEAVRLGGLSFLIEDYERALDGKDAYFHSLTVPYVLLEGAKDIPDDNGNPLLIRDRVVDIDAYLGYVASLDSIDRSLGESIRKLLRERCRLAIRYPDIAPIAYLAAPLMELENHSLILWLVQGLSEFDFESSDELPSLVKPVAELMSILSIHSLLDKYEARLLVKKVKDTQGPSFYQEYCDRIHKVFSGSMKLDCKFYFTCLVEFFDTNAISSLPPEQLPINLVIYEAWLNVLPEHLRHSFCGEFHIDPRYPEIIQEIQLLESIADSEPSTPPMEVSPLLTAQETPSEHYLTPDERGTDIPTAGEDTGEYISVLDTTPSGVDVPGNFLMAFPEAGKNAAQASFGTDRRQDSLSGDEQQNPRTPPSAS